jgi:hypothetical protein
MNLRAVAASLLVAGNALAATNAPPTQPRLGVNLAGPADWNTELPFVDVFRISRHWVSQEAGKPWGQGPSLALDQHGWVTRLASNCWAETPLCNVGAGHYPSGDYTLVYDGAGKIDFWGGAATVISNAPGQMTVRVDADKGKFHLRLRETNPANYVRNIRVFMPGQHESQWSPSFLNRWRGVACLRFMDWMETNNSKISHWAERPTLEDATFSDRGVALEWMIELCNRLKCDAWFCMPHLADDDYVRRFASMVKAPLDPKLKVYVEYSNEVWNAQFAQHKAAGNYTARSSEIFRHLGAGVRRTRPVGAGVGVASGERAGERSRRHHQWRCAGDCAVHGTVRRRKRPRAFDGTGGDVDGESGARLRGADFVTEGHRLHPGTEEDRGPVRLAAGGVRRRSALGRRARRREQ